MTWMFLELCSENGTVHEIDIPDINLNVTELELIYEDNIRCGIGVLHKRTGCMSFEINADKDGNLFTYHEVPRTVTKEQLEKELGYKLDIKFLNR